MSWDGRDLLAPSASSWCRTDQFLCHHDEFADGLAGGRHPMEDFYRWQRRRLGYLMDGDEPAGGRWNFDADNREPPPTDGRGLAASRLRTELDDARPRGPGRPRREHLLGRAARRHLGDDPGRGAAPARPRRRRGAAAVRSARGRHAVDELAPGPHPAQPVPQPRAAPARRGVRRRRGRLPGRRRCRSPRPRASSVRSSAGGSTCGVATGSGCPSYRDENELGAHRRCRRCSPARPPTCAASATAAGRGARPRVDPPHPAADGARQPRRCSPASTRGR